MRFQAFFSVLAFAGFVVLILTRAAMMRRRGIRAIVFGVSDKSDFLLVPIVLLVAYSTLANTFGGLPIARRMVQPFWASIVPGWFGVLLCTLAIVGLVLALRSFGDSFRVGIDEEKPGGLVTTGLFAISRNPIYVCFLAFFIGLFLIHRNAILAIAVVLFWLAIHRQIRREEAFLASHYGAEYESYRRQVRRYL
jgi:protein-S-isoprenylcysteine O-methyltransferase Ste14